MDSSKIKEANSPRNEEIMLSRGDRVVLMFDNFQEYGWVRWVGRRNLHDSGSELMAGVEFDNPIGNDNHKLGDHTLFEAAPNHGYLVPASSLIRVEDIWAQESTTHLPGKMNNGKKHNSKMELPLGSDMSSLSAFHKMAYEHLSGRTSGTGKGLPNSAGMANYNDKENWDILPHMSYSSHKNMYNGSKETLNDLRSKPIKTRSKGSSNKNFSNLLDDRKHNSTFSPNILTSPSGKSDHKGHVRPSTLLSSSSRDVQGPIGIGGGGIIGREDDKEFDDSPTASTLHPLYHLSLNGVDQLDIVSDGEDSQLETPDRDGDGEDLSIGSLVEVVLKDASSKRNYKPLFGVIRWIGIVPGDKKEGRPIAGIEMEDMEDGLSDGTLKGKRHFTCPLGKALFVPLTMCAKDRRFLESLHSNPRASLGRRFSRAFGSVDCQPVMGSVPPLTNAEEVRAMFGRNKGIQGHQNSCYLDATLFSMFAFTSVFDSLLFRPPTPTDIKEYLEVQSVLREEIVNPLRKNMYVRADRIMKLRTMLDHLSSVRGLTTEEKDPEEFLQSLLAQILQAEPFLQLSSGQEAYHYQLFVDKDDKLNLPSVQTLFDQSFLTSDIKLKQIPSCLIIQMPRFGKDYKMYPRILPSMVLDVTDVIEDSPRQCIICGKLAEFECKECYGQCGSGLESIAFCTKCMDKVHSHKKRGCHKSTKKLKIPPEFQMLADHCGSIPRVYMELFAVVCIETSHYVAFTRCGSGADATWCFFDSMADRKGEQHGYNIPTVVECGGLMQWVGEEGSQTLHTVTDNRTLPDLPRRLLCDAYMCFYQSPKVMMYR